MDSILELDPFEKGQVSKSYITIQKLKQTTWDRTKEAWEKDLGVELSEDIWHNSLIRVHNSSLCIHHGLIQFKVLHRLHFSNEKLAKLLCGKTINPDFHIAVFGILPQGCNVTVL